MLTLRLRWCSDNQLHLLHTAVAGSTNWFWRPQVWPGTVVCCVTYTFSFILKFERSVIGEMILKGRIKFGAVFGVKCLLTWIRSVCTGCKWRGTSLSQVSRSTYVVPSNILFVAFVIHHFRETCVVYVYFGVGAFLLAYSVYVLCS